METYIKQWYVLIGDENIVAISSQESKSMLVEVFVVTL